MTKILVIDDELEICKQISLILSKQGYEVTYANSYKEFADLEQRNFDYDVVLVDLWLKNSTKQGIDIIFNNLFKNSIEALETTNKPEIDITLKKTDKKLILTFFDNGPGYDSDIDDLIKPYFSTKNSSGLGLSLINKIITDNSYKMNITTNSYSGFKIEIIFYD